MMSKIQGANTGPEVKVRRYLHSKGFRFRVNVKRLPGTPDIVLPKHRLVIFVHGCYWHRHPGCPLATTPSTNPLQWQAKFEANVARDARNQQQLFDAGWRVLLLWECGVRHDFDALAWLADWIPGESSYLEWPQR